MSLLYVLCDFETPLFIVIIGRPQYVVEVGISEIVGQMRQPVIMAFHRLCFIVFPLPFPFTRLCSIFLPLPCPFAFLYVFNCVDFVIDLVRVIIPRINRSMFVVV